VSIWTGVKKYAWLIDDHRPAVRLRDVQYAFPKQMEVASLFSFMVAGSTAESA
jgi:hypothetical protein